MEEGCHGKTACFDSVEEGMGRERRGEGGGDGGMDNIGRTDRGGREDGTGMMYGRYRGMVEERR